MFACAQIKLRKEYVSSIVSFAPAPPWIGRGVVFDREAWPCCPSWPMAHKRRVCERARRILLRPENKTLKTYTMVFDRVVLGNESLQWA
jgi:hypothetical protein